MNASYSPSIFLSMAFAMVMEVLRTRLLSVQKASQSVERRRAVGQIFCELKFLVGEVLPKFVSKTVLIGSNFSLCLSLQSRLPAEFLI